MSNVSLIDGHVDDYLYFIENQGCDDSTYGLVRIPDSRFNIVKTIIEDLNKNSTYGCKPKIAVYKITEDMIREATDEDIAEDIMHIDGKQYVIKDPWYEFRSKAELVI